MEEENKMKYNCEQCDYHCRFECEWKKHCETTLHRTGERKKRDNYVKIETLEKKCKDCEYKTKNKIMMNTHILNKHSTIENRKKEYKYYCDVCDFGTFFNIIIKKHNETDKHKINLIRKGNNIDNTNIDNNINNN